MSATDRDETLIGQDIAGKRSRPAMKRSRGRKPTWGDRRTWQGKLAGKTREALTAHVGGSPNAVQAQLIETAVQLTVALAVMDAKREAAGGLTLHDGREYLSWANTLRRTLTALGMKGEPQRVRTLADHIADRTAR